ncbi:MAG: tetratricopeptide repeat protein [Gammaproteobacteria bacterium]|nr:tetratricopeptide repeat protein [Gammaproteobacteria bacterium]
MRHRLLKLLAFIPLFLLAACSSTGANKPVAAGPEHHFKSLISSQSLPDVALEPHLLYELLLADIAGQRGDLALSARIYAEVAIETRDPRIAKQATRAAVYGGDYEMALELVQLWVELAPEDPEGHQTAAALFIHAGEVDQAVLHLEHLLSSAGIDSQHGFMLVANILSREKNRLRALEVLEKLLAPRPKDVNALYAYTHLASLVGELDKALLTAERLVKLDPHMVKAWVLKGNILLKLGQNEKSLESLKQALKLDPKSARVRLSYARLLVDARQLAKAREQFRMVAKQTPEDADVIYALAVLAFQAGDLGEAEDLYLSLLTNGQQPVGVIYALGQIAEAKQQWKDAIEWYSAIKPESSKYLDAHLQIAGIIQQTEGVEAARSYFRTIHLEDSSQQNEVYLAEGAMLFESRHYEESKAVYDRALKDFPGDHNLLYARSMVAEKLDLLELVEADLRRVLQDDPDNAQALNALGYTLADRTERYQEAYELIKRALEQHPEDIAIIDSMGWALYRLGRHEEALEYLRRAAAKLNDGEIAAHLGEVLWVSGKRKEAIRVWNKAFEASPEHLKLKQVIERFNP